MQLQMLMEIDIRVERMVVVVEPVDLCSTDQYCLLASLKFGMEDML